LLACAGPATQIVENPRELSEASGAPRITAIRDLGGRDVPLNGDLRPGPGDGVAVIGEVLWILGKGFGRQPTVDVAGRPTPVLSRTADGGILVRVPPGTPAGAQAVGVSQEHGRGEHRLEIRRYAGVIAAEGSISWLSVGPDGPDVARADATTAVPLARSVRFSADGRAAYVLAGGGTIAVVEVPAAGGPRLVGSIDVGGAASGTVDLLAAPHAHRLVAWRGQDAVVIDTSRPLRPEAGRPRPLPPAVLKGGIREAALSPDGRLIAVAVAERNRVVLLRATRLEASQAAIAGDLALEPDVRAAILADVAFAPDGETLWVTSGETADSKALGPQPTRLYAIRLRREGQTDVRMELARTVTLTEAAPPVALLTGRTLPTASGAAIRLPPEQATVYLATTSSGGARRAGLLAVGAEDRATELFAVDGEATIAAADTEPNGRWLLGAVLRRGPGHSLGLVTARVDGRPGVPRTHDLGRSAAGASTDLRIQP
jgi:hypothetical protein